MTVAFQPAKGHLGLITYLLSVRAENTQAISSYVRALAMMALHHALGTPIYKKKKKQNKKNTKNNNKNIDAIRVRKNEDLGPVYMERGCP